VVAVSLKNYLELRVKVDKNWQRRADSVERLGY
jgi:GTPase Era involved in 16S rRNA processing